MTTPGHRPLPRGQLPLRQHLASSIPGAGARGSRDAGHAADRRRGRRHQRRQARHLDLDRGLLARRRRAAARGRPAGRHRRSAREGRGDSRAPAASRSRTRRSSASTSPALPIMTYAVGSTQPSDVTRRQVEDDLKPLLEQIDGVAAVEVNGGEVREMQVNLDPRRLEALNLPITEVAAKLAADNLDVPGGQVRRDGRRVSLRTKGEFQTRRRKSRTSSCARTAARRCASATSATVVDGYEDRDVDDAPERRRRGVVLGAQAVGRQHGRRSPSAIDAALAQASRRASRSCRSSRCTTTPTSSRRTSTTSAMHIIFGGIMAVLVIFVFMRDWRSTLITALALPTSVIATFFFMYVARLHHQHDDADGAVARHRHPDRRRGGRAREHLPPHGARRGSDDRGPQRHRRRSAWP